MAYSQQQWDQVRHWFEVGIPLSEIAKRTEIKDKGSISRKSKLEGWIKGKNATLIEKEVAARRTINVIEEEKATKNTTEREVINAAVAERLKTEQFFHQANLTVAKTAVEKLIKERKTISFAEMDAASRVISRSQDSALGKKEPGTSVSVSVNANAQAAAVMPAPDEYGRVLKDLLDRVI